jgi:hypothetical protein
LTIDEERKETSKEGKKEGKKKGQKEGQKEGRIERRKGRKEGRARSRGRKEGSIGQVITVIKNTTKSISIPRAHTPYLEPPSSIRDTHAPSWVSRSSATARCASWCLTRVTPPRRWMP